MTLVHGGRMQADRLVVCQAAISLAVTNQELRVETPTDDRCDDSIYVAVHVCPLWNINEQSSPVGEACPYQVLEGWNVAGRRRNLTCSKNFSPLR